MISIYNKIDAIFADELEQPPLWAKELMDEIKNLKEMMNRQEVKGEKMDKVFYGFIKNFRISMCADTEKKLYPKIIDHRGRKLGVNFKGLLYEVKTSKLLSTKEAFKVYEFLYKKKNLEVFY
ncbi:MAG: hypothetical protein KAG56_00615 [Sulfurovaceae bacterium]|nr:hypothetical protein [Sulfurovaceae bacterium]